MLLTGIAFFPLTHFIFRKFEDRGWLFAKTIGLFASSWLLFALNCTGAVSFVQGNAVIVIVILCLLNYGIYAVMTNLRARSEGGTLHEDASADMHPVDLLGDLRISWKLILIEEALFFLWFALWVYIIGFKPEAYGTEKFMDYAFMTSMMRSLYMPFADPWYAGAAINYYYGGQYIASFLAKLTGATAGEGYNLMRALIAAGSFMLPFSLVYQLLHDRLWGKTRGETGTSAGALRRAPFLGGLLGGTAVAFCGNFHYIIFGVILPIVYKIRDEYYMYWFPDSTRYIGYNPDLPDKTIHEYPAYSTVLGDLHAHYVNILFVVTVTAVVYAWAKKQDYRRQERLAFLAPEVLIAGFMTGAFRWTNYWDFPIYYVVCGSIFFFVLLRAYREEIGKFILVMLAIAAVMFGAGYLAALPFSVSFVKIASTVGLTHSHSQFYQLLILWGLPVLCLIGFVIQLFFERRAMKQNTSRVLWKVRKMPLPDLAVLMYGLCAAGLVLLPELIYVKDIYDGDHYRANTMFKLTYQSFILFGMCMAYILVRAVVLGARKRREEALTASSAREAERTTAAAEDVLRPGAAAGAEGVEALQEGLTAGAEGAEALQEGPAAADGEADSAMAGNSAMSSAAAHRKAETEETVLPEEDISTDGRKTFLTAEGVSGPASGSKPGKKRRSIGNTVSIVLGSAGIALLLLMAGYTVQSVHDWFGNVLNPSQRIHTDASVFVAEFFETDFEAVNWLNSNVSGQPTILEAPGDSYTDYERVSVATGLPTVIGWKVHEWLWRENVENVDERIADCDTIYTSGSRDEVKALLDKYDISYIYIGTLERERYPDLKDKLLQSFGNVVYSNGVDTYIIEVTD